MAGWRPLWSGHLAFGLITIPVKLYTAIDVSQEPHFRLLDRDTLVPIKEVRVNPQTDEEVPWPQIVRGVEYARGKFVPVTNEELKALPLPTAHTIELSGFVAADEIDPVYFEKAYYLGPDRGGEKAYALLRDALAETGKAGLGKVTIRTRERIAPSAPADAPWRCTRSCMPRRSGTPRTFPTSRRGSVSGRPRSEWRGN